MHFWVAQHKISKKNAKTYDHLCSKTNQNHEILHFFTKLIEKIAIFNVSWKKTMKNTIENFIFKTYISKSPPTYKK